MARAPDYIFSIPELAEKLGQPQDVVNGALMRAGVRPQLDGKVELSEKLFDSLGHWVEVEMTARRMAAAGRTPEQVAEAVPPSNGPSDGLSGDRSPDNNDGGDKPVRDVALILASGNHPDHSRNAETVPSARAWMASLSHALDNGGRAPLIIEAIDTNADYADGWADRMGPANEAIISSIKPGHVLYYLHLFASSRIPGELQIQGPDGELNTLQEFLARLKDESFSSVTILLNLRLTDGSERIDISELTGLRPGITNDLPWTIIVGLASRTRQSALIELPGDVDAFTQILIQGMNGAALNERHLMTGPGLAKYMQSVLLGVKAQGYACQVAAFHSGETPLGMFCAPGVERAMSESVPTQHDQAATTDLLGRAAFAEVVGQRIRQARADEDLKKAAFMVHLHGPWGSGKTSVLNFLRADLERGGWKEARKAACDRRDKMHWWQRRIDRLRVFRAWAMRTVADLDAENARRAEAWVVVDFNAWRHQRVRPPWWSLLQVTAHAGADQLSMWDRWVFRLKWNVFRAWADILPTLVVLILLSSTLAFFYWQYGKHGKEDDIGLLKDAFSILGPLLTLGATFFAWNRSLFFGDSRSAKAATEMRTDVMRPVVRLFQRLVGSVRRPLIVFVDDLDRCEQTYVVELLEGIQTLFREAPVTFLVAADRNWIRTSYEESYTKFSTAIGAPGRPLGHLFLEKMFQMSVAIPRLSPALVASFMDQLLKAGHGVKKEEVAEKVRQARVEVREQVRRLASPAQVKARVEAEPDPIIAQAIVEESALRTTDQEVAAEAERRLNRFVMLVEANPRAMKRTLNAYAINWAAMNLERRYLELDRLVRWTLLEMRWPLLADHLADHPNHLEYVGNENPPPVLPVPLLPLFKDRDVKRVIGLERGPGDPEGRLETGDIELIMGVLKLP